MSNNIENYINKPIISNSSLSTDVSTFQLASVIDIILDESHSFFKQTSDREDSLKTAYLNPNNINLSNYKGDPVTTDDIDYSYVGRIKFRLLDNKQTQELSLSWAIPLDTSIIQYPLLNELVLILNVNGTYFYTKALNKYNFIGANPDFNSALAISSQNFNNSKNLNKQSYIKHPNFSTRVDYGSLGNSFILNSNIRKVKLSEGDTIIESRFGQSIRFSAYDIPNTSDATLKGNAYKLNKTKFIYSKDGSYGNPKIVIRNRQRDLKKDVSFQSHPRLPIINKIKTSFPTDPEKNNCGYIEENINYDGSTIEIISGDISSQWKSTVYKSIFSIKSDNSDVVISGEEQSKFCPEGSTSFKFPSNLNGDQIIINTDRLVLSSRFAETFHFSKKRYSVVTDNEYTVDANDQIVLTTNRLTCLNSPQIFLGQYGETNEPALLGQTTVDWLYDLCNWLLDHVHWYDHVHPHPHTHVDAGEVLSTNNQGIYDYSGLNTQNSTPNKTQLPVQQEQLKLLRDNLHTLMSRRVFLTGGGYALGSNGTKPKNSSGDCKEPLLINPLTGEGVIGDFKGYNRRTSKFKIEFISENE